MGKKIPLHTAPPGPIGNAKPLKPHVIAPAAAGKKRISPHVTTCATRRAKGNIPSHTRIFWWDYEEPGGREIPPRTRKYQPAAKAQKAPPQHTRKYEPVKTQKAPPPGGSIDYMPAFKFRVTMQVGGESLELGFSKISGISSAIQTQVVREGGVNDRVYILPGMNDSERRITFESGVAYSAGKVTPAEKLEQYLRPGRRLADVTIEIFGRDNTLYRKFTVKDAVVSQWSLRELDATSGQLEFQQFEISYGKLVYA